MTEETKPAAPMPAGLRYQERAALKRCEQTMTSEQLDEETT